MKKLEVGFNIFPKPNFPGNTSREDQFPGNSREIPGNSKFVKYYLFLAENEVYVRNKVMCNTPYSVQIDN